MPRKLWTAAEWEKLPPTEQDRIFAESLVMDLSDVSPEFLERVRKDTLRHIAEHDARQTG